MGEDIFTSWKLIRLSHVTSESEINPLIMDLTCRFLVVSLYFILLQTIRTTEKPCPQEDSKESASKVR